MRVKPLEVLTMLAALAIQVMVALVILWWIEALVEKCT